MNDIYEIERGLIGLTQICYEQAKNDLPGVLSPSDFAEPVCKGLYQLFLASSSLGDYHSRVAKAQKITPFTASLDNNFSIPSLFEYNIGRIKTASQARRIRSELVNLSQEADEDMLPLLSSLVEQEQKNDVNIDNLPMAQAEMVLRELKKDDTAERIKTGLPSLDRITGGLRPGTISVLGAYPSAGKTAFALNTVLSAVKVAKKALVFSLEMGVTELWGRLLSAELNILYDAINNKHMSGEDLSRAERLLKVCGGVGNPYLVDNANLIERQTEIMYKVKPDLIVIDFLQYVRTGQRFGSTSDKLEWIISEYKRLAKLHSAHIMALSQMARTDNKTGDMFSLRGSGGIEAGGDYILLLDRPMLKSPKEPPEKAQIKIAKNKYGKSGMTLDLYFDGDHQRFRELAEYEKWSSPAEEEYRPNW